MFGSHKLLTEKNLPIVWKVDGKQPILTTKLTKRDQTLVLLHGSPIGISEENLLAWIGYSNINLYRKNVLNPLCKDRYIELNSETKIVKISPTGIDYVEKNVDLTLPNSN